MDRLLLERKNWPVAPTALHRYAVAVAAVAIIGSLRWLLHPLLIDNGIYLFFVVPVMVAGWFGGLWPAMAATVLGAFVIAFVFAPPTFSLALADPTEYLRLLAFILVGTMVSLLTETLHRSRWEVERFARRVAEGDRNLRFALEAGKMGSWEWDIRTNAIRWSSNLEQIHGIAQGGFDGTYEAFLKLVHPEDRPRLEEAVRAAMEDRAGYDLEFRILRSGGEIGWMRGTGQVIRDASGTPVRMIGLGFDITRQKQAEAAVQRLASIVESSNDAIVGKDLDGNITSWNRSAERLYGYTVAEVLGRPSSILTPDEGEEDLRRIMDAIRKGEHIATVETVRVAKSGRRVHVSIAVSPVKDRGGEVVGASVIARDITERKRLEAELLEKNRQLQSQARELRAQYESMQAQNAELAELDRLRNEFLAMLGHELRNPLAPILAASEILRATTPDDGRAHQQVKAIGSHTRHLARIVDDLLDAARITQGKISLQTGPQDLGALIQQSVEICRPAMEERRHSLTLSLPADPVLLNADGTRIVQVLCNLLHNAARYTEPGGEIRVSAALEEEDAVIRVVDNGRGIASDVLPRIFDLFVQGERTVARSEGGLGVGLTLVRRLVELHGGTIVAHSDGPGAGTEFVVRLPAPAPGFAPREELPGAPASISRRRVLLIDDNQAANETLSDLLELWGHEVLTAETGAQGLELARTQQPQVVLLDIGLPDLDGYEVAQALREYPERARMVVVAVSGYGQPSDRRQSLERGFDDHLVKPVEPAVLRELLERG